MDLVQINSPNALQQRQVRENEIFLDLLIIILACLLTLKILFIGHRSIRIFLLRRRPAQLNRQGLPVVLRRPTFRP